MCRKTLLLVFSCLLITGGLVVLVPSRAQVTPNPPANSAVPTPTPTPDDEVIKIDSDVVNVLFTAQDKNRRLLTDLKPSDVTLFEDGKQQEITAFSRQIELPLSLAILVDVSVSQQRTLPEEKAAAVEFLESVVRPSKDEVSV